MIKDAMSNRGFATKEGYEEVETRLRSSLASVLLHMAEQMPEKEYEIEKWVVCKKCKSRQWEYRSRHSVYGYSTCCGKKNIDSEEQKVDADTERNAAIDDCKAILINEAKKITEAL